jgi:hypothetical protein
MRSLTTLVPVLGMLLLADPSGGQAPPASSRADGRAGSALEGEEIQQELMGKAARSAKRDRDSRERRAAEREREQRAREERAEALLLENLEREDQASTELNRVISEQQALQQALLREAGFESPTAVPGDSPRGPRPPEESALGGDLDPRVADLEPAFRELPPEIFDHHDETIRMDRGNGPRSIPVTRLSLDADGDGKAELIRFLDRETLELLRQEEDRNYDGLIDAWSDFRNHALSTRILDENDDGNPDVFENFRNGRIALRELDRDDDGVRDVLYRYRGDSLIEERHDANNDGVMDLVIAYENRMRLRSEEDVDRDGRMDIWTRYSVENEAERIVGIDRDSRGRGFADIFESFGSEGDRTLLIRREEDTDGDGSIDIVSFYVEGLLRRRQISQSAPPAMPATGSETPDDS